MPEIDGMLSWPLIEQRKDDCAECWCCVRCCPVRAIRITGGRSEIVQEKCIGCGQCVSECSREGFVVRDDTHAVRALFRSHRPVVALLASEFIAALYPMTVSQVERSLESIGFSSVETTLLGEELVASAYEKIHARSESAMSIRSTCPVVVDYICKFHPAFVPALAPLVPPYLAQARLIRSMYPSDIAIVYVSPCYARKDEIRDPEFAGAIDVAIDFTELKRMIVEGRSRVTGNSSATPAPSRPTALKEISLTDGFPRHTLASHDLTDCTVSTVRGIEDIDRLLTAIEAGETAPQVIDMLNCEGCIDGPTVNPGLSLFAKRNVESAARRTPGTTRVSTRSMLSMLPSIDLVRSFVPRPVSIPPIDAQTIDRTLAEGEITRETALDCGACGWPTCVEHAVAVHNAESTWDLCLPLQRRRLAEDRAQIENSQTLDGLTGVWNRRIFGDRLAIELARVARYGTPLCLVLLDLDAFGEVNGALGRDGGDRVLAEVARRIGANLRTTDVLGRWTGDRFVVALPGVNKTEAFVVAEKLREAICAVFTITGEGGYTQDVAVTASIGVASATLTTDVLELFEVADAALLEALRAGGDTVRLARG
ncbi:MAG: diguanylate cyclase [Coriobacteriia bacterium]|nr:diguanylate cyclase [Coriobacteriia bacterium]